MNQVLQFILKVTDVDYISNTKLLGLYWGVVFFT